ncbi:hypothetical protein PVL29_020048 [Vitis rotundifolia]|uniref:Cytochrome P450 87A3 n=1 Tax=Vitis rotundifolia TaxID=103349 RepID=A0AA38Z221_VITRO|nr:hypothetical protein PVL29_020048 [Vitis rotundifolia]
MWEAFLCLISLFVIWVSHWVYRWVHPKCNGQLPPGSMGWPVIGETIDYFLPHSLYDLSPFITKRMTRYGSLFRTSLIGQRVVVSTDPELNHYIFQQEGKLFQCWYTESFFKILGQQSLMEHQGVIHKYLKGLILNLVSPENLKQKLLHEMDSTTRKFLHSWANCYPTSVDVKEESANMIFECFAKKLLSYEESKASKKLMENYKAFMDGLMSFPLNIPGTAYHACLKGRENAMKVIRDIVNERKLASKNLHHDFLDHLLEEVKKEETILSEEFVISMVFVLLFATYETTSAAIAIAIHFLSDHPSIVAELTKEHEGILQARENEESEITWEEYKSMTFTHMVINETIRLANIVPGIFRRVTKDVHIKGYTIPEGWIVVVCPSVLHLDPTKYKDPFAFNPWRWEGPELHAGSKNFMAFGGGVRLCVGAHFAKLQMAIFLHYLVTKYRWTNVKGGDIIRRPGLAFPNGLHIQVSKRHK